MTATSIPTSSSASQDPAAAPDVVRGTLGADTQSLKERVALSFFIGVPFVALVAAVPVLWGWGLSWTDLIIAVVMYAISGHGVTVGFHRLFTHSSFKAEKALRVVLAIGGSLVRVALLHHTTWSINSICHAVGSRPFRSRDRSGNVWWLAVLSMGESWHNLHHSDPTAARHGVLRGQIDSSARIIWVFEKLGWVRDVRWPSAERIAMKQA